ncbi:uncharacterized protein LOC111619154 [Centruroides sculpturatus]|uniref:uncharacterized protein LOC111619154 n=1 Tax=Centruroides sculpturatus TaxID=218467 RepID=UPI000C6C9E6F|nr:uncharacterized protein LOC111619154 [Centruroides sculpturatus]
MSNVEEEGTFNYDKVTIVNDNEESVVVSLQSLKEKAGLLKYSITVCPNEMKFFLKVPLTLEMLNQFSRFLDNEILNFTIVDGAFEMYLFSKRYFINQLKNVCFNYISWLIFRGNACRAHDLACRHNEKQLQYHCFSLLAFSDRSIFRTDDFRSCEETTVYKLLTSPIYVRLEEFDLLMGLRMWVEKTFLKLRETNANISKRDVMKPFISFIRFFVLDPDRLKQIVDNFTKDQILTEEEVQSIRQFLAEKNVALLPTTITASIKRRNINDYSVTAVNYVIHRMLKVNIYMKPNFQFMIDILFCENCYAHKIKLPIIHNNPRGINVLVGVKAMYTQDFVYEKRFCYGGGIVYLQKTKYLPKRTFYIFSVKVPEKEIHSNIIEILKDSDEYVPIYDFRDDNKRRDEEITKFSCDVQFSV